MSTAPIGGAPPEWDLADRMRKALRTSGVGVNDMADYLGVARNTVSTWINGRIEPSTQTIRLWALRTGVPYEWLKTGESSLSVDSKEPYLRVLSTHRNHHSAPALTPQAA